MCRPQVQKLEQHCLKLSHMMLLLLPAKSQSLPLSLTRPLCLLTQDVQLSQRRNLQVSRNACVFMWQALASTSCYCSILIFGLNTGNASSLKVTPAPAKRRKLLVLGSSKDTKVQQTSTQKHGSPTAGAKSLADDGPPQCKSAASSMLKVQKTHKTNPQSGTPHILGESLAS